MHIYVSLKMLTGIGSRLNILLLKKSLNVVHDDSRMCRGVRHDGSDCRLALLSSNLLGEARHGK